MGNSLCTVTWVYNVKLMRVHTWFGVGCDTSCFSSSSRWLNVNPHCSQVNGPWLLPLPFTREDWLFNRLNCSTGNGDEGKLLPFGLANCCSPPSPSFPMIPSRPDSAAWLTTESISQKKRKRTYKIIDNAMCMTMYYGLVLINQKQAK